MFDVHAHTINDNHRQKVKVLPPGKDDNVISGLSVWKCNEDLAHDNSMIIDSHPDFFDKTVFLERSNSDGILIRRNRFFCYILEKETTLHQNYALNQALTPVNGSLHVDLYPRSEIILDEPYNDPGNGKAKTGILPNLEVEKWNTCSVLIAATPEEFLWLKGGGEEPDFKRHQDPECEVALLALSDFMQYADAEESFVAWNLIWFFKKIKTLDYLATLPSYRVQFLSLVLEDVSQKTHPDDHPKIFSLFRKVVSIYEQEIKTINGNSENGF
jgi:hypothetical protein